MQPGERRNGADLEPGPGTIAPPGATAPGKMRYGNASAMKLPALLVALLALGCANTETSRVRQTAATMDKEQRPAVLLERGKALAAIGDLVRAEQYLTAALERGADETKVTPVLMRVCLEGKRYRAAIDYGEAYLRKHPKDARLRYLLGTLYYSIGDVGRAHEALKQVTDEMPDHADAHYALAIVLYDGEHDVVSADKHFRAYVQLEPHGPHADEARASMLRSVP
jgi:tetratricopeptide (TPR) repeat protein